MAQSSFNDTGLTYLHPTVTSVINSEEISYQNASGNVRLFTAIVSEKGEDGKTNTVTSPEEFIFKYGNPNLKKYGQAGYNVLNWLSAGGEADILRVLPDNAGFAHAFLNIQTKSSKKKVQDVNGKLVEVNDVFMRPIVTYAEVNNVSDKLLEYELLKERDELTVDEYKNNFLFVVYPTGRGSSYNNLGFRISLNTSFEDTYDSRIYNFEVIRFDEYNTANLIEGPFYVSFDPDTLSSSNESMFIEDVINKYSKHLKCKFNEESFDYITSLINKEVAPGKIDVLTGKSRLINDKPEAFFSKITSNYEDIHFSLHRYDRTGKPLTTNGENIQNIPASDDEIENSIVIIDNKVRDKQFETGKQTVDTMKTSLKAITNDTFVSILNSIINSKTANSDKIDDPACSVYKKIEKINTNWTLVEGSYTSFLADKTDANFFKLNNLINTTESLVTDLVKELHLVADYCRTATSDLSSNQLVVAEQNLNDITREANKKEIIVISGIAHKGNINKLSEQILDYKLGRIVGSEIEGMKYLTTLIGDEYDYVSTNLVNSVYGTTIPESIQTLISASATLYNEVVDLIQTLADGYVNVIDEASTKATIYNKLELIIDKLYQVILESIAYINLSKNETIKNKVLNSAAPSVLSLKNTESINVTASLATPEGKIALIKTAKLNIDLTTNKLVALNSIIFTNALQNFNNPIKFANGSDGDLEIDVNNSVRDKAIKDLLIKGYKGLIDPDITNKRVLPFQHVLDANYPVEVKNAMIQLARDIRRDIFAWMDTGFHATPEQAITWKKTQFSPATELAGLFSQDFVNYDEHTGRDIKVTISYYLANKIPSIAKQYGLQYPIAGPRRGIIDGYKAISYIPNENHKEEMYRNKINYVESDTRRTKIGSQLTCSEKNTPLANINNVLTLLDIKRNVEILVEDYQFEFEDIETINALSYEVNNYLSKYITNRSCEEISATVEASDYDKLQKILRVKIKIKFNNVIERILISLDVVK